MLFGRICSRSNRKVNSSGTIRPGSLVIACDKREAFAYGSKVRRNPFSLCGDMDCFAEPVIGRAFARPGGSQ